MGGILIVLFGTIVVVGISSLVRGEEDWLQPRNIAIIGAVLVLGVGGMSFQAGSFAFFRHRAIQYCGRAIKFVITQSLDLKFFITSEALIR